MNPRLTRLSFIILILCAIQIIACSVDNSASKSSDSKSSPKAWWESVTPIIINGDEFYGKNCSVTKVSHDSGIKSATIIFKVPGKLLTYCKTTEADQNDLEYDGAYIILHSSRQTIGAGSSAKERFRSADFKKWEEYIGITWVDGKKYEAWRKLGSTSSKADSRKKVERD